MWAGQDDTQKFKTRVLKPPGGGSSDIFGSGPEETSPRRVRNHNQSQLGSALFDSTPSSHSSQGSITNGGTDTPRCNKPGNDSYNRLFGPPPPITPKSKTHMRSNITLNNGVESKEGLSTNRMVTSPAKSTSSYKSTSSSSSAVTNGFISTNGGTNGMYNDVIGGSSCMPRNPVTGDGIDVTPQRRSARRCRDPNPVTGTGYPSDHQNNGPVMSNGQSTGANSPSNSSVGEKTSDSSSAGRTPSAPRTRVPPGGYSSGLW